MKLFTKRDLADNANYSKGSLSEWKSAALATSYDEWRKIIEDLKVSEVLRTRAACIVWWDFFSGGRGGSFRSQLDCYVNSKLAEKDVDPNDLIMALHLAGYPFCYAEKRIKNKN